MTNEDTLQHIKHNEWYLINHGMNLARIRALGYYVDTDGKRYYLGHGERDAMYEHMASQIESRGRSILALKDQLTDERVSSPDEKWNVSP